MTRLRCLAIVLSFAGLVSCGEIEKGLGEVEHIDQWVLLRDTADKRWFVKRTPDALGATYHIDLGSSAVEVNSHGQHDAIHLYRAERPKGNLVTVIAHVASVQRGLYSGLWMSGSQKGKTLTTKQLRIPNTDLLGSMTPTSLDTGWYRMTFDVSPEYDNLVWGIYCRGGAALSIDSLSVQWPSAPEH